VIYIVDTTALLSLVAVRVVVSDLTLTGLLKCLYCCCLPSHKLLVLDQPRFIDINIAEQYMQLPIQYRQSSEYGLVCGLGMREMMCAACASNHLAYLHQWYRAAQSGVYHTAKLADCSGESERQASMQGRRKSEV
jgi:hypothetical protein